MALVGSVGDCDGGGGTVVIGAGGEGRRGTATAETSVGVSAVELPWIYRCWSGEAVVGDKSLRRRAASGGASHNAFVKMGFFPPSKFGNVKA